MTHYPQPCCSCDVVPTVVALRAYAAEICDAEVAHALARLEGLSGRDAFVVRALAERIVGNVVDRPIARLQTHPEGANMARILRQLFQLEPEAGPTTSSSPG